MTGALRDPGSGNGASQKQNVCQEAASRRIFYTKVLQAISAFIPSWPLFGEVRAAVAQYLNDYQAYIRNLDDLCSAQRLSATPEYWSPDYVAPCTGVLFDNTNVRRVPGDAPVWFALHLGQDQSMRIIASNDNRTYYLVSPNNNVTTERDNGKRTLLTPQYAFWIDRSRISIDVGCIDNIPIRVPAIGFPAMGDFTGAYYRSWEGTQRAMEYARTHSGWWGENGLDIWGFAYWVLYYEAGTVIDRLRKNLPDSAVTLQSFMDLYVSSNYARFRDAFQKCQEAKNYFSGEECEGFYQFLSGFTASMFPNYCTEPPEDLSDREAVARWRASLDDSCANWEAFVLAGTESYPESQSGMGLVSESFETKRSELDLVGDFGLDDSWRDHLPHGVLRHWSTNEIPCDIRANYVGSDPYNPELWVGRWDNTNSDRFFYIGTTEQFNRAGVSGGLTYGC